MFIYSLLIKNPENMRSGKNVGPINPNVASKLGVIIAKNAPFNNIRLAFCL